MAVLGRDPMMITRRQYLTTLGGTTICVEWESAPSTKSIFGNEINTFLTINLLAEEL